MGQIKVSRTILYTFVGLFTYFFSEKFLVKKPKSKLDIKGGDDFPIKNNPLRLLLKDQSVKIAIAAIFIIAITTEVNAETVSALAKLLDKAKATMPEILRDSSPAILAYTPVASDSSSTAIDEARKVMKVVRLKSKIAQLEKVLKAAEIESIREVVLNETLSPIDKVKFLLIKVKILLKNLKGRKRYIFMMALLSLIYFILANNTIAFTTFWSTLRELFKLSDLTEELENNYIIEWYQEFNETLPEELINKIME